VDIDRNDPNEARLEAEGDYEREQAELSDKAMAPETALQAFQDDDREMMHSLIQEYGMVKFFETVFTALDLQDATKGHEDLMKLMDVAQGPSDEIPAEEPPMDTEEEFDRKMAQARGERRAADMEEAPEEEGLGDMPQKKAEEAIGKKDRGMKGALVEDEVDEEMSDQALQTARDRISHELNREPRQAHICPECGSDQTEGSGVNVEGAEAQQDMVCNKCAHEWTNQFRLMESEKDG